MCWRRNLLTFSKYKPKSEYVLVETIKFAEAIQQRFVRCCDEWSSKKKSVVSVLSR